MILTDSELYYQIALSQVPGVGPVMSKHLIGYCGGAEAVFKEPKSTLARIPGVGELSAGSIYSYSQFDSIEKELDFIQTNNIRAIHYSSPDYPLRLKQELDSPIVLYVKGETDLNHSRMVAIIGTRKNTNLGAEITRKFVEEFAPYNVHIISGLAYGIDIAAHKASIEYNVPTIAVVAHGLDTLYPGQHRAHASKMIEAGGCIVSEHISGTALNPDLFPRRNRIVAALCDCVIVVESQKRGGSMITAEIASSYNRDVFAVPGSPIAPMSEGCNYLIKSLKAGLCESAQDVTNGMNWELSNSPIPKSTQSELFNNFTDRERSIVEILQNGDKTYDELFICSQIPVNSLSFMLLDFEMRGIIRSMPGKRYSLIR